MVSTDYTNFSMSIRRISLVTTFSTEFVMDLKCSDSVILCQVTLRAPSEFTGYWTGNCQGSTHLYDSGVKKKQQIKNQEPNK